MTIEQNKQVVIRFNKEFFESGNPEIQKLQKNYWQIIL